MATTSISLERAPGAVCIRRGRQRLRSHTPAPHRDLELERRAAQRVRGDVERVGRPPCPTDQARERKSDGCARQVGPGGSHGRGEAEQRAAPQLDGLARVRGAQERDLADDDAHDVAGPGSEIGFTVVGHPIPAVPVGSERDGRPPVRVGSSARDRHPAVAILARLQANEPVRAPGADPDPERDGVTPGDRRRRWRELDRSPCIDAPERFRLDRRERLRRFHRGRHRQRA